MALGNGCGVGGGGLTDHYVVTGAMHDCEKQGDYSWSSFWRLSRQEMRNSGSAWQGFTLRSNQDLGSRRRKYRLHFDSLVPLFRIVLSVYVYLAWYGTCPVYNPMDFIQIKGDGLNKAMAFVYE